MYAGVSPGLRRIDDRRTHDAVQRRANEAYEDYRQHGRTRDGRRFGHPPNPHQVPDVPTGKVNVTDPDTGRVKTRVDWVQGYNAQAVVDEGQIVLAAEITNSTADWSQLGPMLSATIAELARAGSCERHHSGKGRDAETTNGRLEARSPERRRDYRPVETSPRRNGFGSSILRWSRRRNLFIQARR